MKRNRKKLIFQNVEEALTTLNGQDRGRYFICECPECEAPEAFIYKNNVNYIQCNRESECGERMLLVYRTKEDEKRNFSVYEDESKDQVLTRKQMEALSTLTNFVDYMRMNTVSKTLDDGYRGIGRTATEPFVADLHDPVAVKRFFEYGKGLFPKDYSNSDWMCKRNLVFPIYGDNGLIERVLMRSSVEENIEPKEIQLIVNPAKDARDFFVDIDDTAERIVIGEAILDTASFREIDSEIGILALTGTAKVNRAIAYIENHREQFQNKQIVLAFDNDAAGREATKKMKGVLNRIDANYAIFPFPNDVNDANEFLIKNRSFFESYYSETLSTLSIGRNKMNHKKNMAMER